ncbi:MAG: hypothetical protein R6V13_11835 [Anaerolineae bacterium]
MFSDLFNFEGINWWTLLGGIGLNFIITMISSIGGAYLAQNKGTAEFYRNFGSPLMILVIFAGCIVAGFVTGKIADNVPVKHAFISSLGAVAPFLFLAITTFNPIAFMMAAVAVAGNLNGGRLAIPRRRHAPPSNRE